MEPVPDALVLTGGTSSAPVMRSATSPPMLAQPVTSANAAASSAYFDEREMFFMAIPPFENVTCQTPPTPAAPAVFRAASWQRITVSDWRFASRRAVNAELS
jgi:hypothetical protein